MNNSVVGVKVLGFVMNNIKKIVFSLISLTMVSVLGHRLFCYFFNNTNQLPMQLIGQSQAAIGRYDFGRMLSLIEQSRELKAAFYEQYQGFPSKKKIIDVKYARELLSELYREKVRIERYIQAVKIQFKGQLTPKKARTLLYYQKVIYKCIDDVEFVLRQA